MKKINLKSIMKNAWAMYKEAGCKTKQEFSIALKCSWADYRQQQQQASNVVMVTFNTYNSRRFGTPWVSILGADGRLDFTNKIGAYYANDYSAGSGGELIVTQPFEGQVYAYGQKDYSGKSTIMEYVIFSGGDFLYCNKFGKIA